MAAPGPATAATFRRARPLPGATSVVEVGPGSVCERAFDAGDGRDLLHARPAKAATGSEHAQQGTLASRAHAREVIQGRALRRVRTHLPVVRDGERMRL